MKCSECEFGKKHIVNRRGVVASARVGGFSETAYECTHENISHTANSILFCGKTRPKNCPLKVK